MPLFFCLFLVSYSQFLCVGKVYLPDYERQTQKIIFYKSHISAISRVGEKYPGNDLSTAVTFFHLFQYLPQMFTQIIHNCNAADSNILGRNIYYYIICFKSSYY